MLKNYEIAELSDINGNTVSHFSACNESIALELINEKPEIVLLKNNDGITVLNIAIKCVRRKQRLLEQGLLLDFLDNSNKLFEEKVCSLQEILRE